MSDPRPQARLKRRLSTLVTAGALVAAFGVFLYGLLVGQRIEAASGLDGVGLIWWLSVLPVVIGILVATLVTTQRTARRNTREADRSHEDQSEEFERSKAATLARLSALLRPSPPNDASADRLRDRPRHTQDPDLGDADREHRQVASETVPT